MTENSIRYKSRDEKGVIEEEEEDDMRESSICSCCDDDNGSAAVSDTHLPSLFPGFADCPTTRRRRRRRRKKELSPYWRKLVNCVRWRCKWAELRLHCLVSQQTKDVHKLDRHHHLYKVPRKTPKIVQLEEEEEEDDDEDDQQHFDFDTTSYISQHPFFSFYGRKKSVAGIGKTCLLNFGPSEKILNNNVEFNFADDWLNKETKSNDITPEQILWRLEVAKSRFRSLRARVDKLISDYSGKFSSPVIKPRDASRNFYWNLAFPNNGDSKQATSIRTSAQQITYCQTGDNIMSEAAVLGHGNASRNQSTFERANQHNIGSTSKITDNKSLTNGQTARLCVTAPVPDNLPDDGRANTAANFFAGPVPKRQRKKRHKRIF